MTSAMESQTVLRALPTAGAPETDRVGASRSDDLEVGNTMGPPSLLPRTGSCVAIIHRVQTLTQSAESVYTRSAGATPELFHGTRGGSHWFATSVSQLPILLGQTQRVNPGTEGNRGPYPP